MRKSEVARFYPVRPMEKITVRSGWKFGDGNVSAGFLFGVDEGAAEIGGVGEGFEGEDRGLLSGEES